MWFRAGDTVRIPVLKELSVFKTLDTFAKSLKITRDWPVTKGGGEGSWRGRDIKPVHRKISAWQFHDK